MRKKNQCDILFSMATTLEQLLADKKAALLRVQAAIVKAEKRQEYMIDDGQSKQSAKRGNLQTMYDKETKLENDILALENSNSDAGFVARPL